MSLSPKTWKIILKIRNVCEHYFGVIDCNESLEIEIETYCFKQAFAVYNIEQVVIERRQKNEQIKTRWQLRGKTGPWQRV